jgi:hypothetical protein
MSDFDSEIEFALHRKLDSLDREAIPLRRTVQSRDPNRALVGAPARPSR